jgi:hypothetical protein
VLLLSAWPQPAAAQTGNGRVAIGASVRHQITGDWRGKTSVGLLWRIGRRDEGWGFRYGLNWYSAHLDTTIGERRLPFGDLRLKPFMGGYGYTRDFGRVSVSANLLAGFALSSFSLSPSADRAFRDAFSAASVRTEVTRPWVLRPEISAWIDTGRKVGVNLTVGYSIARPRVVVDTPGGRVEQRVRGDMFGVKIGAVYSVF